jgi:hypothetical protein
MRQRFGAGFESLFAPGDSPSGLRRAEAASAAQAGSRPPGAGKVNGTLEERLFDLGR